MYINAYIYICICKYICMHTNIHAYKYFHVHIYIYTDTSSYPLGSFFTLNLGKSDMTKINTNVCTCTYGYV